MATAPPTEPVRDLSNAVLLDGAGNPVLGRATLDPVLRPVGSWLDSLRGLRSQQRAESTANYFKSVNGFEAFADASNVLSTQLFDNYDGEWARQPGVQSYGGSIGRIPLIITTEAMAAHGRYIVFWTGVESAQWNLPLRGELQKTRGGSIQHYYKDYRRDTYYDEATVQFSFQSGNIMPVRITQDPNGPRGGPLNTVVRIPIGLMNFYEFLEVLNQKKAVSDGRVNYVYILYSSMAFPRIMLRGFFDPGHGVSFSESASEGAEIKWSANFTIADTYPRFQNAQELKNTWNTIQQARGFAVHQASSALTTQSPANTATGTGTEGESVSSNIIAGIAAGRGPGTVAPVSNETLLNASR